MRTINLFILIALFIGMTNCNKDENDEINVGITFLHNGLETKNTSILVNNDEIKGYDSTSYAYILDKFAWKRISDKIEEANVMSLHSLILLLMLI